MAEPSPLAPDSESAPPPLQPVEVSASSAVEPPPKERKKDKGEKKIGSNRGIETMFRVTYENHIQLSHLADNKANMLIGINGLIISIVIAFVSPQLYSLSWAVVPAVILLVGCMTSLAFAVTGTRPRLNRLPVTLEDARSNRGSVLFFGRFLSLSQEDFETAMHALMQDRQTLYDNMIREIYAMGRVLMKKYRHLQIAYAAFLITTGVAVGLFVAMFLTVAR
jgi:hypothetical protein